jgi:ribosomal protein S18 acetylase RimI-like enzyme
VIRTASPQDIPEIQKLEDESFNIDAFSHRRMSYLIKKAQSATLVYENNGIRGYILLLFRMDTPAARVYSICVHPAYRKMGIGTELMRAAERLAVERKCTKMTLEVSELNSDAIAFYQALGFRTVKKLENYYSGGVDGLRMEKTLP